VLWIGGRKSRRLSRTEQIPEHTCGHSIHHVENPLEANTQKLMATSDPLFPDSSNGITSSLQTPGSSLETHDELIPIRLDITHEGIRYTDAFSYPFEQPPSNSNYNYSKLHSDLIVTPLSLSIQIVNDEHLPQSFIPLIQSSITSQIDSYSASCINAPFSLLSSSSSSSSEAVVPIDLNVRIGRIILRDRFLWDLSAPVSQNCPDKFALHLCREIGFPSSFIPQISIALREEISKARMNYVQEQFQMNLPAEFRSEEHENRGGLGEKSFYERVLEFGVYRNAEESGSWQPTVECLTLEQVERVERQELRDVRVARRSKGVGGGSGIGFGSLLGKKRAEDGSTIVNESGNQADGSRTRRRRSGYS